MSVGEEDEGKGYLIGGMSWESIGCNGSCHGAGDFR